MGVQRAAVVLGFTVLVSSIYQSLAVLLRVVIPYLLGGSCFFPLLLALLRAMGSKSLTATSGFAGASANDVVSTSGAASVEALRRNSGWIADTVGLASLHRAVAVRYGSSRRAMMCDVVLVMDVRPNRCQLLARCRCRSFGLGVETLQGSSPRAAPGALAPARYRTPRGALAQRSPAAFKMLLCG